MLCFFFATFLWLKVSMRLRLFVICKIFQIVQMFCCKAVILNPLRLFFFTLVNREWPIRSTVCYAKHGNSNSWFWEWSKIHSCSQSSTCFNSLISFINTPINYILSFVIRYRPNVRTFSGTSLGSTCKHANVTCPGGKTTYPVTCSLGCPQYYSIKGASTITCQTSGQWTSYASSYCRRNNDPPSQVTFCENSRLTDN